MKKNYPSNIVLTLAGMVAVAACLSTSSASAAPIFINNHSFETDVVPRDGNTATVTNNVDDFISPVAPTGWTSFGAVDMGVISVASDSFFSTRLAATPDADGPNNQAMFSNSGDVSQQTLGTTLLPNTTYTLTVDVGDRTDTNNGGPSLALGYGAVSGANLLTPISTIAPPTVDGGWVTYSSTFQTGPAPAGLGQPLRVELITTNIQAIFDNVRLDAVTEGGGAIPEPSTFILATLGLPFLFTRRRRRR